MAKRPLFGYFHGFSIKSTPKKGKRIDRDSRIFPLATRPGDIFLGHPSHPHVISADKDVNFFMVFQSMKRAMAFEGVKPQSL